MRKTIFTLAILGAMPLLAQDPYLARAKKLAAEYIGIDTHIDTAQRVLYAKEDLTKRTNRGHVDIPRLREGGVRAPFFALWVPTYYKGGEAVRRTLDLRDAMQGQLDAHADQMELAASAADIERVTRAGKIAVVLTAEGGHQIGNDLAVLRQFRRMSIMAMTLSHFRNNEWADSSTDKPVHNGLVAIVPDSPLSERKDYYGAYKETRTDQNGGFEIGGITPGAYQVYAWADAPASIFRNADFMKAFVGKGTRLAMEINGKMKVELSPLQ